MKIIVSGGTGFVGKALVAQLLAAGHEVILLSRSSNSAGEKHRENLSFKVWDGKTSGLWTQEVDGADAVINLAGESIANKRWIPAQKKRIADSRLESTRVLVHAIKSARQKPSVLINASAVGYYGNVPEGDVTELHSRGKGFLAELCDQWEYEALKANAFGVRVVLTRFGIVLERGGGALSKMELPFQFFAGGPLGSGRQWFPWIHRDDVVGIILFALQNSGISGAVNVTAPEVVTMKDFCAEFGKVMRRPSWAPVPAFILRLVLGEMSEMLLEGQRAIPQKISTVGYRFKYPKLYDALSEIFRKR